MTFDPTSMVGDPVHTTIHYFLPRAKFCRIKLEPRSIFGTVPKFSLQNPDCPKEVTNIKVRFECEHFPEPRRHSSDRNTFAYLLSSIAKN